MAGRIRTIKPEILSDAKAAKLSHAAWRLWVSTWVLADDEGRLPADPDQLHGQVFWGCSADVHACLAEIQERGLAMPYVAGGDIYLTITNFRKHQRIDRPSGAKYPAPEPSTNPRESFDESSSMKQRGISTATSTTTTTVHPPSAVFDFEAVYKPYPRKQGKQPGLKAAKTKVKTDSDYQTLLSATQRMGELWRGHDLTYCPLFSTFVNQERWRDEQLPAPSINGRARGTEPPPSHDALPPGVKRW